MANSDRIDTNADGAGSFAVQLAFAHLREAKRWLEVAQQVSTSVQGAPATPANLESEPEFGVSANKGATYAAYLAGIHAAIVTGGSGANQLNWAHVGHLDKGLAL